MALTTPSIEIPNPKFTVIVGTGEYREEFHVDERFLKQHSPYFAAMIDSPFLESTNRRVVLDTPVDTPMAFAKIAEYMVSGSLYYETPANDFLHGITHIYVFLMAHRLLMEHVERRAYCGFSTALLRSHKTWEAVDICWAIDEIYTHTAERELDKTGMVVETFAERMKKALVSYCATPSRFNTY